MNIQFWTIKNVDGNNHWFNIICSVLGCVSVYWMETIATLPLYLDVFIPLLAQYSTQWPANLIWLTVQNNQSRWAPASRRITLPATQFSVCASWGSLKNCPGAQGSKSKRFIKWMQYKSSCGRLMLRLLKHLLSPFTSRDGTVSSFLVACRFIAL